MQNFVNSFAHDIKGGTIYSSSGTGEMAFIDVGDIAKVNAEILKNPKHHVNQEYEITGSELLSFSDAIASIAEETNRNINVVDVSLNDSEKAMLQMGYPKFIVEMLISLNAQILQDGFNKTTNTVADITGNHPKSFATFAKENRLNWL